MTDSVGTSRSVYATVSLWRRVEEVIRKYEEKTEKRFKSINTGIAMILERGVEALEKELSRP